MVNSLGGRGLSGACIDAGALFPAQRIADAYGVLRILSTNPLIDRQRIALMGFSHGGIVTTMSATTRTKQVFVLPAQPSFRAFARSTLLQLDLSGNVAALRASADTPAPWTIGLPRSRANRWSRGCPPLGTTPRSRCTAMPGTVSTTEGRVSHFSPSVLNGAVCAPRAVSILGPLQNPDEITTCVRRGARIGGNRAATTQARAAVLSQLSSLLN